MKMRLMRTFEISGVKYQLLNDKKHLIVMRQTIDNIDNSFRWGIKTLSGWKIYIGNEYQICLGGVYERLTPEDVARKMLMADKFQTC